MKEDNGTKNIIAASILGLSIIIAAFIYAYSNRYYIDGLKRIDRWTGKVALINTKQYWKDYQKEYKY